jgi:hypothetical protein
VSDAIRLIGLNGAFAMVGAVFAWFAGIPAGRGWRATLVGVSPAVGIAACGLVAALCAMTGPGVGLLSVGALVVLALVAANLLLHGRRPSLGTLMPRPRGGIAGRTLELVALVALAVLSVAIFFVYAATGLGAWDGWAMWAPKAHALYVEGDVWGSVFRDSAYLGQHQEYPVLLPSLEALSADALGRFDRELIDIESGALLVSFGWGAWGLLRLVVAPWLAAGVALGLTGSLHLIDNGSGNYADTAVASFTALGLLCALVGMSRGATAPLALSAIFFAACAMTKVEGLLFALAAIATLLATARGFGRPLRSVAWFAGAVLVTPAAWAVVDRLNGPGARNLDSATLTDPDAMLAASGRIPEAAWRLVSEIWDNWPRTCVLVLAAVLAASLVRLWWHVVFLVSWGVLAFGGLVAVYYASAAPIDWLLGTSADRVVFSVVLALASCAPVLVGRAWEVAAVRSEARTPAPRTTLRRAPSASTIPP